MVIIRKGKRTIKVSQHTYDKVFKKMGYVVIQDEGKAVREKAAKAKEKTKAEETVDETEQADESTDEPTDEEWDDAEAEAESVPVSEMTKAQLIEYAKQNNININGATSATQIRKVIQKEIRNRNM